MASGSYYGRPGLNCSPYQGPYPKYEVQRARNTFFEQFYRSKSKAIRSLRFKTRDGPNFFHKQQIQSVVSESFGAIQVNSNETEEPIAGSVQRPIDIHTLGDDEDDANKKSGKGTVTHLTDEPTIKRQKLTKQKLASVNNETVTSTSTTSASVGNENETADSLCNENVTTASVHNETITTTSVVNKNVTAASGHHETDTSIPIHNKTLSGNSVRDTGAVEMVTVDSNGNISEIAGSKQDNPNCNTNVNEAIIEEIIISDDDDDEEEVEILDEDCHIVRENCYKCDLCSYMIKGTSYQSEVKMMSHFQNARHNSASLVEAEVNGVKLIPKYVEDKMILTNPNVRPNIFPVCPECNMVHASIWNCAMHYQTQHSEDHWDVYGLGNVVEESSATVDHQHICKQCQKQFPTASKLHKHWRSFRHFPFTDPKPDQIMHFLCVACGFASQSFMSMRAHGLNTPHYDDFNQLINTTEIRVLYIQKPSKHTLIAQKPKSEEAQIQSNKKTYERSMNIINATKCYKKMMKKRILPKKESIDDDLDRFRYEKFINGLLYNY